MILGGGWGQDVETFLLGVLFAAVVLIAAAVKFKVVNLEEQYRRVFPLPPEPEQQAPEPQPIEAEIVVEPELPPPPPNYGNIRPVLGEEEELTEFGEEVHDFPEGLPAVTRFEDFNRRLFLWRPGGIPGTHWLPDSTLDDFPTRLVGSNDQEVLSMIVRNLRPRYPVILDEFGWWGYASSQLEMEPDYTDPIVEAYLAIPEHDRPVVITRIPGLKDAQLKFYRYGFAPWHISREPLAVYPEAFLTYIMAALRGPREVWLWMSVARMRQAVIHDAKKAREEEEQRKFLQDEIKRVENEEAHGGNAWRTLWGLRPPMPMAALPDAAANSTEAPVDDAPVDQTSAGEAGASA